MKMIAIAEIPAAASYAKSGEIYELAHLMR
jgi:hypothetical protein